MTRTVRNAFSLLLFAIRQEKKWVAVVTTAFCFLFIFLTGMIARYNFIPEWVPSQPTLFAPTHPLFETYAATWRLSGNWLFTLDPQTAIGFVVFPTLVAANTAVFFRLFHLRLLKPRMATMGAGGAVSSLVAFFGCCVSPLTIAIFGSGIVFALSPYSIFIQGSAALLLVGNLSYLVMKLQSALQPF